MLSMIFGLNLYPNGGLKLYKSGSLKLHNIMSYFDSAFDQKRSEFSSQKWTRCRLVLGRQKYSLRGHYRRRRENLMLPPNPRH